MLPCFNACGQWMLQYFIFPGKRVPVTFNLLEGGVEGSIVSMTETGYMDTQTFYMWFANHFIPNLPPARPLVLLIDSHDSHLDLETFQLAQKNGICLYSLLKNASHLVQPADVGLFGISQLENSVSGTQTVTSTRGISAQSLKGLGRTS